MLFLKCFDLCSAIIKENIHLQRWELLLDLHLYYSCVNSGIVYAFLGAVIGLVYLKEMLDL